MFTLLGIDHLVLRVTDMARMRAFYEQVLGCKVDRDAVELGLLQLRAGRSLVDLVSIDGPIGRRGGVAAGAEGRNLDHFCLRIEPWDEPSIRAHLRLHGVEAGQVAARNGADGVGPSIYLDDPEGNTVELKGPPAPL